MLFFMTRAARRKGVGSSEIAFFVCLTLCSMPLAFHKVCSRGKKIKDGKKAGKMSLVVVRSATETMEATEEKKVFSSIPRAEKASVVEFLLLKERKKIPFFREHQPLS
jgi:hypothetical protein